MVEALNALVELAVDPVAAVIAVAAAAILFLQVRILSAQKRLMEVATLNSLREEWREHRAAWIVTLAISGSMYVDIDSSVIDRFPTAADVKTELESVDSALRPGVFKSGPPAHELTQAVRDTLEFLAMVCSLVLRGRITPAVAYEALGPSVVRNAANLRRVVDEMPRASWYMAYYPGIRQRVLVLLDLPWVEALRTGDQEDGEVSRFKVERGTGARNRRRIREAVQRPGRGWRRVKLQWYLTDSEVGPDVKGAGRIARRVRRFMKREYASKLDGIPSPPDYPNEPPLI